MMPSTSKKQHNFMAAIANNPAFAKKVGVPQSVGKDFNEADKGRKFSKGGDMATRNNPGMTAMMAAKARGGDRPPMGGMGARPPMGGMGARPPMGGMGARPPMGGTAPPGMKKGGAAKKMAGGGMTSMGKVKTAAPSKDGVAIKGKTKGKMITMKSGGKAC
jgi:hypothetical protein